MNQYTPLSGVENYPEINRKIMADEYDELVDYAVNIGVRKWFYSGRGNCPGKFYSGF